MDYQPGTSLIEYVGLGVLLTMLGLGIAGLVVPDAWLRPLVAWLVGL